jgi:hypothetical protein
MVSPQPSHPITKPSTLHHYPASPFLPWTLPSLALIPFPSPLRIALPTKCLGLDPLELAQKYTQSGMSECKRTPHHSPLYKPHISSSQLPPNNPSPRSAPLFAVRSSMLVPNTTHRHTNIQPTHRNTVTSKQGKLARLPTTSPMGRHGNEASPSMIHTSSIALLQERFRNLQKVKEMREGRELQRVHATDTDRTGSSMSTALNHGLQAAHSTEQPSWFSHPDLIRPSRPLHGPAYGFDAASSARTSAPPAISWGGMQNSSFRNDVDVDTSLHL